MKQISIFVLMSIVILMASSCKKMFGDGEGVADVVFKYKNEDYVNYVGVHYSEKKNKVVGYPDSTGNTPSLGLNGFAGKCSNGYYFASIEGCSAKSIRGCYTDITFSEYKEIWKTIGSKDMRDTLTSRVIDRDPYEEIYSLHYDSVLYKHDEGGVTPNIDKINELIESGEFFTYEGVERVK